MLFIFHSFLWGFILSITLPAVEILLVSKSDSCRVIVVVVLVEIGVVTVANVSERFQPPGARFVDVVFHQSRKPFEYQGKEYYSAYVDEVYVNIVESDLKRKYGISPDDNLPDLDD